jgi:hypothetical protein|tara:strand:- start:5658 stop:5834 length:177 start_codon:yes stop_codon:yes gene_type:complete
MNSKPDFSTDFLSGQRDCAAGKPHQAGKSEAYDRGYAAQYQHEQNMTALSESQYGVRK